MQINRAELQKVRVKLSRDALTIQKEGRVSPSSSPINRPEVGQYSLFDTFLIVLSRCTRQFSWIRFKFFTGDSDFIHLYGQSVIFHACNVGLMTQLIVSVFRTVRFLIYRCSAFIFNQTGKRNEKRIQSPVSRGGACLIQRSAFNFVGWARPGGRCVKIF